MDLLALLVPGFLAYKFNEWLKGKQMEKTHKMMRNKFVFQQPATPDPKPWVVDPNGNVFKDFKCKVKPPHPENATGVSVSIDGNTQEHAIWLDHDIAILKGSRDPEFVVSFEFVKSQKILTPENVDKIFLDMVRHEHRKAKRDIPSELNWDEQPFCTYKRQRDRVLQLQEQHYRYIAMDSSTEQRVFLFNRIADTPLYANLLSECCK